MITRHNIIVLILFRKRYYAKYLIKINTEIHIVTTTFRFVNRWKVLTNWHVISVVWGLCDYLACLRRLRERNTYVSMKKKNQTTKPIFVVRLNCVMASARDHKIHEGIVIITTCQLFDDSINNIIDSQLYQ